MPPLEIDAHRPLRGARSKRTSGQPGRISQVRDWFVRRTVTGAAQRANVFRRARPVARSLSGHSLRIASLRFDTDDYYEPPIDRLRRWQIALKSSAICATAVSERTYTLSLIHISEPTRQAEISYAVFCLKKKK